MPALALRHSRDWQSLAYLVAAPALVAWQWHQGFNLFLYALLLFLTLGIGVIHHNHTHVRLWSGRYARWANRLTDAVITVWQGHPTFVFWPAHVANHHRHTHGPNDVARTYRFGSDSNHLWGYLLHPFQAVWVLFPLFVAWLVRMHKHHRGVWRYCMSQYVVWLGAWGVLLAIDPWKAFIFVILPQLHGLHWLLATNYLQHAHANGAPDRRLDYARNFEGWVNPLLFNIGLHTAHHEHPRAHWSALTELHRTTYRDQVPAQLNEGGLLPYMGRVFLGGVLYKRWRSQTSMTSGTSGTSVRSMTSMPCAPTVAETAGGVSEVSTADESKLA